MLLALYFDDEVVGEIFFWTLFIELLVLKEEITLIEHVCLYLIPEVSRLHLAKHFGELMHFQHHHVWIELLELLASEPQIMGSVSDFIKSLLLQNRHFFMPMNLGLPLHVD